MTDGQIDQIKLVTITLLVIVISIFTYLKQKRRESSLVPPAKPPVPNQEKEFISYHELIRNGPRFPLQS